MVNHAGNRTTILPSRIPLPTYCTLLCLELFPPTISVFVFLPTRTPFLFVFFLPITGYEGPEVEQMCSSTLSLTFRNLASYI